MSGEPTIPATKAGRALLAAIRASTLDPAVARLISPEGKAQLVALVSIELLEQDIPRIEAEARAEPVAEMRSEK